MAALAVVSFHYTGRDNVAWAQSVRVVFPFLSRFTIYGGFGPYLFFIISGFVVLMSAWGRGLPTFIGSRVARLYPAYWVAVLVTATVLFFDRQILPLWSSIGLPGVAINLTMLQSAFGAPHVDGVFWTLWVELKFYILLAGLVLVGITRARVLALCLIWPVVAAMASATDSVLLTQLLEPHFAPFFCIGILLYLVHREGWTGPAALLLALNFCFALWVCSAYYIPWSIAVAGAPVSFRGLAVLLTLCVGAVAAATLTPLRRLDWAWLSLLGALTYPLYLMHQETGWILLHHLSSRLPAYVAVGAVTLTFLVAAYLVHRFVERPLTPALRRVIERDLGRSGARTDAPWPRHETADLPTAYLRHRPPAPMPQPRSSATAGSPV